MSECMRHYLAGHTADPNSLHHDRVGFFDRLAAAVPLSPFHHPRPRAYLALQSHSRRSSICSAKRDSLIVFAVSASDCNVSSSWSSDTISYAISWSTGTGHFTISGWASPLSLPASASGSAARERRSPRRHYRRRTAPVPFFDTQGLPTTYQDFFEALNTARLLLQPSSTSKCGSGSWRPQLRYHAGLHRPVPSDFCTFFHSCRLSQKSLKSF